MAMSISVVIPAYNEEENIGIFYDQVSAILDKLPYKWEMIFVNDGSKDHTAQMVSNLHQRDPRVCLLSLSRNFGSYGAITAGLFHARGDAVVCISCDLQDPPELIVDFVREWEKGADIVWGVRATRVDPGLKALYANTFYWVLRKFIWKDFPSGGMDYGLFDQRIIALYNQMPVRNTIPFLAIYNMGFHQMQLPYHRRDRERGKSNWPFLRRLKSALDVLLDFSYIPIRAVSLVGYIIAAVSFTYGLFVVFNRIVLGIGGSGWPSVISLVAFLGGVQLAVLGMLGEYVWRVAEQVRGRPRFLIADRLGFAPDERPGTNIEMFRPHQHRLDQQFPKN
jgi:polyisoprenyl-phosphate glycosyltransferase